MVGTREFCEDLVAVTSWVSSPMVQTVLTKVLSVIHRMFLVVGVSLARAMVATERLGLALSSSVCPAPPTSFRPHRELIYNLKVKGRVPRHCAVSLTVLGERH